MNKQQIFDTVVKHLAAQKTRSYGTYKSHGVWSTSCLYHGPNGTKCAVGCLIPDEKYSPDMEGLNVYRINLEEILCLDHDYVVNEVVSMLLELQRCHDTAMIGISDSARMMDASIMRSRLEKVAYNYNLDNSCVKLVTEWKP